MKHNKQSTNIFTYFIVLSLMLFSVSAAQLPVDLGSAENFAVLSKSGISATGSTLVTGNIGVSPIDSTAITGFGLIMDSTGTFSTTTLVNGSVYASDYTDPTPSVLGTAISNMLTAYTDAAGRTLPDATELGSGNIGGLVLTPGLYKWGTGVIIPTDVTLSGSATDVWVFQIAGTLQISSGKQVLLAGGALADNVFWQVADATTLGTTSTFNGNILDLKEIIIMTGATLNGRALSQTAVTLDANAITSPGAVVPIPTNITLTPLTANLTNGATLQLNASVLDQFGLPMVASITYVSNATSVATVNTSGFVTAAILGNFTRATITASSGALSATSNITVLTTAPILASIGSKSVTQSATIAFVMNATSANGFNLSFVANGTPVGAVFTDNGNATATFNWTPLLADVGVHTINFTVSDGIKSDSEVVVLTVNANDAPATAAINPGVTWQNADFNVTLNSTAFGNASVAYINYTLNNVSGQIFASSASVLINVTGNNTLRFYAVDDSGLAETPSTIFALLDKIVPEISSFTLSETSVFKNEVITGSCTATDNLDSAVMTAITGIDTSITGTRLATCTATDAAGNSNQSTLSYTITSRSGGGGGGGSRINNTVVIGVPVVSTAVCASWSEWSACDSTKTQTGNCVSPTNSSIVSRVQACTPVSTVVPVQVGVSEVPTTTQSTNRSILLNTTAPGIGVSKITGQATSPIGWMPSRWIFVVALISLAGLGLGGYFFFRK